MNARTQITMDPDMQRRAQAKAADDYIEKGNGGKAAPLRPPVANVVPMRRSSPG